MPATLRILSPAAIDPDQWDACVKKHPAGLIYSRFQYLAHCCDDWRGLVQGDYAGVMALPLRRKFAIPYIYQPAFIQQLGWIGEGCPANLVNEVLAVARYGDLLLNFENVQAARASGAQPKLNLVIDLSEGYETISAGYRKDLLSNLAKAGREEMEISNDTGIAAAIALYQETYGSRMPGVADHQYRRFSQLCEALQAGGECFTRSALDAGGTLLATGLFLSDGKRVYNMMNSTTEAGRQKEANHFLLDAVIREFSGQSLLFDFEGSDLPGVKSFYEKFGPLSQPYFIHHFNRLPFPLRLLKR